MTWEIRKSPSGDLLNNSLQLSHGLATAVTGHCGWRTTSFTIEAALLNHGFATTKVGQAGSSSALPAYIFCSCHILRLLNCINLFFLVFPENWLTNHIYAIQAKIMLILDISCKMDTKFIPSNYLEAKIWRNIERLVEYLVILRKLE